MKGQTRNRMRSQIIRRIIVITALLLAACMAQAQLSPRQEVDSLFNAGEFEQIELIMLRIGNNQGNLSDADFLSMKTTAGFAMIMLDREADARRYFMEALALDPNLTLDPVLVSPKFRVVFDDVKASMQNTPVEQEDKMYVGARPSSHVMNLLLPGVGQLREGSLRGAIYLAAQGLSLYLLIDQLDKTSDSRAYYLAQTERSAIARAYDDYNKDYKTAWKYGIISSLVYIAAQADLALLNKPLHEGEKGLSFSLHPEQDRLVLQVNW